jgi:hypothetical protein
MVHAMSRFVPVRGLGPALDLCRDLCRLERVRSIRRRHGDRLWTERHAALDGALWGVEREIIGMVGNAEHQARVLPSPECSCSAQNGGTK